MGHISRKLSNSLEGALAGGGDPATSPLYVFGPFLRLIVAAGVAQVTFGASIWLVILTIAMVSGMYRLVMLWVTDGSGGSGLSEEEFGSWAVKTNAGITFVEYTLTFLVSMAALVTFIADRAPILNTDFLGVQIRTFAAILLSILTGWVVNRGPKITARTFGPATAGVLLLLWALVFSTIAKYGIQLPDFNFKAFTGPYLHFTIGGYARILAVMTGIEIFANLVAAYDGPPKLRGKKAFGSLLIIMGTTGVTMLIVGPAILRLSDPNNLDISVFTQTMDQLLPAPLAWFGTLLGVAVLLSACAASAQGLQNLAVGLRYRHYVPAALGQHNRYDVADIPVWIEVGIVSLCFLAFGTHEETYLALYAAGVFILLSMTGWAASWRLLRQVREQAAIRDAISLAGTSLAALLTSAATLIVFEERFFEGAWAYFIFIPVLYLMFTYFHKALGKPTKMDEYLGRVTAERKYLPPLQESEGSTHPMVSSNFSTILVPLDGSLFAEQALALAQSLAHSYQARLFLLTVDSPKSKPAFLSIKAPKRGKTNGSSESKKYLQQISNRLKKLGVESEIILRRGVVAQEIIAAAEQTGADLIVMSTHGRGGIERLMLGSTAAEVIHLTHLPMLLLRPTLEWRSRWSEFRKLIVPLDGSENAEKVLPYVCKLGKKFTSEALLLAVPEGGEAGEQLSRIQAYLTNVLQALRSAGFQAQAIVIGERPARTIVSVAESEAADLIMIATHGRTGIERMMLGSVADMVLQTTTCPVFLVPTAAAPETQPALANRQPQDA